jgi:hypothetical protein
MTKAEKMIIDGQTVHYQKLLDDVRRKIKAMHLNPDPELQRLAT